jgi:serine/threonine protein kinase
VENKFDRRIFALKQIRITPREDLKKVVQEVENLSKVGKHKNIVKYLDCFIVQEEVEGDAPDNSVNDDFTNNTASLSYPSDHSSFINFDSDASSLQQVKFTNDKNSIPLCESSEVSSHNGSQQNSIAMLTCICIKMEFCDFTLDQLLGSLKASREVY